MRVALNAYFLTRRMTGSGRYVERLLAELPRVAPEHEYLAFGPARGAGAGYLPAPTPFDRLGGEDFAKLWLEQLAFPRAARRVGAAVAHYPYFAAPLLAAPGAARVVVTVLDVIPLILPEYRASAKVRLYNALVAAATRRAALVLTISEASRRDILRHIGVPGERVRVTPLAVEERFSPDIPGEQLAAVRQRYGLPEEYVLYFGGFDRRKNTTALLEAYGLARRQGLRLPLVLAGGIPAPGPLFPDLRAEVARRDLTESVLLPGWIADDDQPSVFAAATLFVFPSLYEGFGFPPLEAMACGTPVVCSNTSSLPEVVGDAALQVDPTDVTALATGLLEAGTSAALREGLRARGLARAAGFRWADTAAATARAYEAVASG